MENLKMKTKIKTKNEFQNPDLIFGNEIQKRKSKLKKDDKEDFQNEKQNFKGNQLHYGIYLFILCLPT